MSKKLSILLQLIFGFSLLILMIVISISYFSYKASSKIVLEKTTQYMLGSVKQLEGKLEAVLQDQEKLTTMIELSPFIQDNLIALKNNESPPLSDQDITSYIDKQTRYSDLGMLLKIYDLKERTSYTNSSTLTLLWNDISETDGMDWANILSVNKGKMLWFSSEGYLNGKIPIIFGARQINDWNHLQRIGTLFAAIPTQVIENAIRQFPMIGTEKIQIVDSLGKVVYSTDQNEIGTVFNPELLKRSQSSSTAILETKLNAQDVFISYSRSNYSGWSTFAYINGKLAVKDLSQVQRNTIIVGLLGMIAGFAFIIFFSWSISKPIRHLSLRLKKLDKGITIPFRGIIMNKEMDTLYTSYNTMLQNLDRMITDLSEKQNSEKQAQLVALKAQFRPHFLYNTLNTIYWSLINKQQKDESEMVLALSGLLRYSIDKVSEFVTLQEDLNQLDRFIFLLKLRYEDKIHVELNIPEELLSCKIMRLILQPLVENSITHGLESLVLAKWLIRITVRRNQSNLIIIVEDNGKGMTPEEIHTVMHSGNVPLADFMHTGIGLSNLQARITLIYGQDYGMSLSQSELGGLLTEMTLPYIT